MRRITALLIVVAAILRCSAYAAADDVPSTSAAAWAVYDATAGRFLASGNADEVRRMASTTKIMTALVAIESFSLDAEVQFSREMIAEGSSMYLRVGEKVSLRDLLHGLLMMSGNDAARAIASLAHGGEHGFVALMNARAASLGLTSTSFSNPNGLDSEDHYTTARELSLIAAEALNNSVFREIVSTSTGVFAGRSMTNHNKLLRSADGCIGVKTGYTSGAGRCLVSAFERNGRCIIITTLCDPNDWNDHIALCEWAYNKYAPIELIAATTVITHIPVESGAAPFAEVCTEYGSIAILSEDEALRIKRKLYLPKFVYAPVFQGEPAGELALLLDGKELARIPLIYNNNVSKVEPHMPNFTEKMKEFFETLAYRMGLC